MDISVIRTITSKRTKERLFFYFVFLILPFIFLALLFLVMRKNPLEFNLRFGDELDYWAETATLIRRGLFSRTAGYFGFNFDSTAPLLFYGAHGLFSLIPFALFGHILPWTQQVVLVLNPLLIGLSLALAYSINKSLGRTLIVSFSLFIFYPFYLYFSTGMIETSLYAGSIFLAALCVQVFKTSSRQSLYLNLYYVTAVLFSLVRITNLVFLIPSFFIELVLLKRNFFLIIIKYSMTFLLVIGLTFLFAVPFPWGFLNNLKLATNKLEVLLLNTHNNVNHFFDFELNIQGFLRFMYSLWLLVLIGNFAIITRRTTVQLRLFQLSMILVLLILLIIIIMFYDIGSYRDFRVLSPVLSFSVISYFWFFKIETDNRFILSLVILALFTSNLVVYHHIDEVETIFIADRYEKVPVPRIFQKIKFNPTANSRWENTAYLDLRIYHDLDWNNYDPGIGLMSVGPREAQEFIADPSSQVLNAKYLISAEPITLEDYELTTTDLDVYLYTRN